MPKANPLRTCIATGEEHPPEALLRFVVSPEDRVVFDIKGNLPGRGMYVKPQKSLLAEACKRNAFARSAKQSVKIDANLPEVVEQALLERALAYLGRAQLAAELVTGFEKVSSMLKSGEAGVLLHTSDAGGDGIKKLDYIANGARIITFCDREILGKALQKENPVHLAVKKGGISSVFIDSYDRWAGFRGEDRL